MSANCSEPRNQVFDAIVNEWVAHAVEIDGFVYRVEEEKVKWAEKAPGKRIWSFELDLNRWAREGCRKRCGWKSLDSGLHVYPNPRMSADALVTIPGCDPVLVEIKAVTNVTQDKWISKINEDTGKLATKSPYPGLQIIACFDTFDPETADSWTSWLRLIDIWNVETSMVRKVDLPSGGTMLVKGWAIPCDAQWCENLRANERRQDAGAPASM
jgi:hypothetical protein